MAENNYKIYASSLRHGTPPVGYGEMPVHAAARDIEEAKKAFSEMALARQAGIRANATCLASRAFTCWSAEPTEIQIPGFRIKVEKLEATVNPSAEVGQA